MYSYVSSLVPRYIEHIRDGYRPVRRRLSSPVFICGTSIHPHIRPRAPQSIWNMRILFPWHSTIYARRVRIEMSVIVCQSGIRSDTSISPCEIYRSLQRINPLHVRVTHGVNVTRHHLWHPSVKPNDTVIHSRKLARIDPISSIVNDVTVI